LECVKKGRPNQLVGDDRGVRGGQRLATVEKQGLFRLSVLRFLDAGGRVDMQRVMHLRTASNFSMQPPGMSAAQSLTRETDGFGDMRPAVENLWRVGSRVAREIVNNWDVMRDQ
jgi:purine nucleoside permease